ncbi:unnamed protein product, partial [Effrenium voratum]
LAPDMYRDLAQSLGSLPVKAYQENSYWWLLQNLDMRGRGLVLMDPPYEPYEEYMAWNLFVLRHLHEVWPECCVAVWYPSFTEEQTNSLYLQLSDLDVGDILIADFGLNGKQGLQRSGLALLGPPPGAAAALQRLLRNLAQRLGGR